MYTELVLKEHAEVVRTLALVVGQRRAALPRGRQAVEQDGSILICLVDAEREHGSRRTGGKCRARDEVPTHMVAREVTERVALRPLQVFWVDVEHRRHRERRAHV